MIGIDTNVLVRFLAQDDPSQSPAASKLLENAESSRRKVRINLLVLLETAWVLRSAYGHTPGLVLDVCDRLLDTPPFVVESSALVREAVGQARRCKHELPDVLIGLLNGSCKTTWTFDAKAAKLPGFTLLKG